MDSFPLLGGKNQKNEQYEFFKSHYVSDIMKIHNTFDIKDIQYKSNVKHIDEDNIIFFIEIDISTKKTIKSISSVSDYVITGNTCKLTHIMNRYRSGSNDNYEMKLQKFKSNYIYIYEPVMTFIKVCILNITSTVSPSDNVSSESDISDDDKQPSRKKNIKNKRFYGFISKSNGIRCDAYTEKGDQCTKLGRMFVNRSSDNKRFMLCSHHYNIFMSI